MARLHPLQTAPRKYFYVRILTVSISTALLFTEVVQSVYVVGPFIIQYEYVQWKKNDLVISIKVKDNTKWIFQDRCL
jgi:hypothetical protein